MSIRDELKAKREQYQKEKKEAIKKTTHEYEDEARNFIENKLIPRFRKLASRYPDQISFVIGFGRRGQNYKELDSASCFIEHEVLFAATQLASEYDIEHIIVNDPDNPREITYISFFITLI